VRVQTSPAGLSLNAINSNGYAYSGPISGALVVLKDNPATTTDQAGFLGSADESLGCSPTAYTWNGAAGKIAVAKRGSCARVAKAIFGQQGGSDRRPDDEQRGGPPPFEGKITSNPDTGDPFTVTIPFVGIAGNQATATTDSGKLQASPAGSTAVLSEIPLPNANYGGFASFSSGGPRTGDSNLKPDVTAPGVSILSTASAPATAHDHLRHLDGLAAQRRRLGARAAGSSELEAWSRSRLRWSTRPTRGSRRARSRRSASAAAARARSSPPRRPRRRSSPTRTAAASSTSP
jgi:hypothetical protein